MHKKFYMYINLYKNSNIFIIHTYINSIILNLSLLIVRVSFKKSLNLNKHNWKLFGRSSDLIRNSFAIDFIFKYLTNHNQKT